VPTDEELVEACLDGAAGAFEALVDRYQERLLRFLLTRSASRADAEDAIQDTFISAYRYLASFDPRWRFSTWLYRIAMRQAARQRRQDWQALGDEPAGGVDPLQACMAMSERENVWLAARRVLNDDSYAALWLRYVEDMPVREVSRALDRSLSWTKVALMRSRRRLADELRRENENRTVEQYG